MQSSLTAVLRQIEPRTQRQDSTLDQLADLRLFANRLGMYDAADFLRIFIERGQAAGAQGLRLGGSVSDLRPSNAASA